jgi:hypothetical protein
MRLDRGVRREERERGEGRRGEYLVETYYNKMICL